MKKSILLILLSFLTVIIAPYVTSAAVCTPGFSSASYGWTYDAIGISDFSVSGYSGSISDASTPTGSGYENFYASDSVVFEQGTTNSASITAATYAYNMDCQVWIDFNNNNVFESSESVGGATTFTGSTTFNIVIPLTAAPGFHRMRLLMKDDYSAYGYYPYLSACASGYVYGDVRDYLVRIYPLPTCTGTPTAGTASSTAGTVCPSESFTLSLTGTSFVGSLAFQWQSSPDSATWTNITSATTPSWSMTETATKYYRCKVLCTASTDTGFSNGVKVNYISVCYCTPSFALPTTSCSTYNFSFGVVDVIGESGTSIMDSNACDGTGYEDRTALSCNLMQSVSYLVTVVSNSASTFAYPLSNQFWIDFNNDGTFDASESVGGRVDYGTSAPATTIDTLRIPFGAATGVHRMRAVQVYYSMGIYYPSISSCPTGSYPYDYGEARDYDVNIVALPACTGTPTAGSLSSSVGTACPSTAFNLTLTGYSTMGSMTFTWQTSPDSSTWTTTTGSTSTSYTHSESTSTYYRVIVTCTVSGRSDTTAGLFVPYVSYCYCTPSFSSASASCSTYNFAISGFYVNGESSTSISDGAACDGSGYRNMTTLSCNMMQSVSYTATVVPSSGSALTLNNMVWIDFNDDGNFATSECVGYKSGYSTTTTETLTMPLTATLGTHRMRIVQIYASCCPGVSYPSISSCPTSATYTYGEARDYDVNIVALPPCSGTPTAGHLTTSSSTACPSYTFTLNLASYTVEGDLSFVWQTSSDSSTWTTISGVSTTTYSLTESSSTYYRVIVKCTISGLSDTTAGLLIPYVGYCYCTPTFTGAAYTCSSTYYSYGAFASFHAWGEFGTAITDNIACDGSGYENHTYMSATYMQTRSYTDTIVGTTGTYSSSLSNQVWIDFNNDGTFASSEAVAGMNSYSGTTPSAVDTFSMSSAAALATSAVGTHRMRVMQVYSFYASFPTMNPCGGYYYGEARDYTINLVALPACSATPSGGAAASSAGSACPSYYFNLSVTGETIASGLTYQWQDSSAGTSGSWTNISGATSVTYGTTESVPTYYRLAITCTTSGMTGYSSPVFVDYVGYCYCTPSYADAGMACGGTSTGGYSMGTTGFLTSGVLSTSIVDHTHCNGITNYENNTGMSVSYLDSTTYTAKIYNTSAYYMEVQAWIDFSDNGTFETSESVGGYSNYLDSATFNIVIPAHARYGVHRMRVVTNYHLSGTYYPYLDPCTSGYLLGDARDYDVDIVPTPCTGTPTAGTAVATTMSGCASFTSIVSLSGASSGSVSYQWQSSTDSATWTNIAGATSTSLTVSVLANTYYRAIVTCGATSSSSTSVPVHLVLNAMPSAITGPDYVCSGATVTFSSTPTGGTWTSGALGIATIGSSSGVITGVATGTAPITYTLPTGCSVSSSIIVNPTPAAITGTTSICIGTSTTLTDASLGGAWSSSSTAIATVSSTGVVYGVTAGSVTISYTLPTGCAGPSPTTTRTVVVNPTPSITGSFSVCLGYTTTLVGSPSGGTWTTGSSTIAGVDAYGDVHGIAAGTAIISYVSTAGCAATTAVAVNTVVTPTLTLTEAPGTTVCAGTEVTFTAAGTGGGSSPTYVWSVDGVISGAGTTYTYAPANGDVVSVRFLSTAVCAIPDTIRSSVTMTVNPVDSPTLTTSTGIGDTICLGSPVTITATPFDGGTHPVYEWWVNGASVADTSSTFTYTPSEGDVITTRLISNAPCRLADSSMTSLSLTVSPTVTPSVLITSTAPGSITCVGTTVNFTANPTNGGTAPAYQWFINSTGVGTGNTYSYGPTNGDTVEVIMTSNFPCVTTPTASNSTIMTVEPVAIPVGVVSVAPGYILSAGESATFTCTITGGGGSAPTYQWTVNGAAITGATNSTYTTSGLTSGDVVSCTVVNTDPCSSSSTFNNITVTIAANTGVTSVNQAADITILPNPNKGSFVIKGAIGATADENVTIEVTDVLGQTIYSEVVKSVQGLINQPVSLGGKLASGMYLVNVKSEHLNKVFHFVIDQ